jgi:hypothetical protein
MGSYYGQFHVSEVGQSILECDSEKELRLPIKQEDFTVYYMSKWFSTILRQNKINYVTISKSCYLIQR